MSQDSRDLRIEIPDHALSRLRILRSPLWECVASLLVLAGPQRSQFPYRGWTNRARAALAESPTARLLDWIGAAPSDRLPGLLLPAPTVGRDSFEDELAYLNSLGAPDIRQLTRRAFGQDVPAGYQGLLDSSVATRDGLTTLLGDYWKLLIEPEWRSMSSALEEEILFRGRLLAGAGSDGLLANLHPRISWQRPVLRLSGRRTVLAPDIRATELVLVPVLFARSACLVSVSAEGVVGISYQARGAGILSEWRPEQVSVAESKRLGQLIGSGRAAVLMAIGEPATTATVAARLGLAPSTVSQHLTTLTGLRLAARHRIGNRVLYQLTQAGAALLVAVEGGATTDSV